MRSANLSVIMPNYNHAQYLPRAIAAVLGQSVRPREFIIIDDGSTDNSVEVIERFAARDPVIRFFRNERNRGVCESVNRALEQATGEYLLLCAADDYVLPGIIEKSIGLLEQHPNAGICCGYHSTVDGTTGVVSPNPTGWCRRPTYFSPSELADVMGPRGIPSSSAIYRREAVLAAGGYLPALRWACDWFMNLVIAFRHGLCHVPEPLALIQIMPTSYGRDGVKDREACRAVVAELLPLLTSPEYCYLLPHFQVSGVLAPFGQGLEVIANRSDATHELRVLASLLLGPVRLRTQLDLMRGSRFWRLRNAAVRCKGFLTSWWRRSA